MKTLYPIIAICLGLIFTCACEESESGSDSDKAAHEEQPPQESSIERGSYLVGIMGCNDCHTPKKMTDHGPEPDLAKMLMGFPSDEELPEIDPTEVTPGKWALFNGDLTAAVGPWGITYAANLTPHESGLGAWSYEQFKNAMTKGMHKGLEGGRMILPPMPWQNYVNMKEEDLRAVFEFLQSIPPIENVVPAPVPPGEL